MPKTRVIANFSWKQFIGSTPFWIVHILLHLWTGPRRFLPITPPWIRRQLMFDFENHDFVRVYIRDWIEYRTLCEIFLSNSYGFNKFKRHSDITTFYEKLVFNQLTPLILDLGGNIGLASRYFAETYPNSLVVCIEPKDTNMMQAQINNNRAVKFIEAAIGSAKSKGKIYDPKLGNDAFRVVLDRDGSVEIISVTEVLGHEELKEAVPFIIKIDIEGFENELFSKNIDWIDQFPILIIELHDWLFPKSANSLNFLQAISGRNRDFIYVGENIFSFSNTLL